MVWMTTFCFSCSVRLGVLVSAVLSMVEVLVPLVFFIAEGAVVLSKAANIMQEDEEYSGQTVVKHLLRMLSQQPEMFVAIIETYLIVHFILSFGGVYGALRLLKWPLVPYGIIEFARFVVIFTIHVIAMIVLKKILNLGILIVTTIAGSFVISYRVAAVVAMWQIINLVHSTKYRALYGEDPFHPREMDDGSHLANNTMVIPSSSSGAVKFRNGLPKKRLPDKTVVTIPIVAPDIELALKEFQVWYLNEFLPPRRSNLMRFS